MAVFEWLPRCFRGRLSAQVQGHPLLVHASWAPSMRDSGVSSCAHLTRFLHWV